MILLSLTSHRFRCPTRTAHCIPRYSTWCCLVVCMVLYRTCKESHYYRLGCDGPSIWKWHEDCDFSDSYSRFFNAQKLRVRVVIWTKVFWRIETSWCVTIVSCEDFLSPRDDGSNKFENWSFSENESPLLSCLFDVVTAPSKEDLAIIVMLVQSVTQLLLVLDKTRKQNQFCRRGVLLVSVLVEILLATRNRELLRMVAMKRLWHSKAVKRINNDSLFDFLHM